MAVITLNIALELFKENCNWFGSPALLRVSPALVTDSSRDYIIDGAIRFEALSRSPHLLTLWRAGKMPHLVFAADREWSTIASKVLPRMLALAGHYDRAYVETPEIWRQCSQDIAAYLGLPPSEAFAVFATRQRLRRQYARNIRRHDPVMANRSLVRKIRQLIVTSDETGQPLSIDDIRRVVFNDSISDNG